MSISGYINTLHGNVEIIYGLFDCRKVKKKSGGSVSYGDGAPDFALDVILPSICPAVVINSLVSIEWINENLIFLCICIS